MTNIILCDILYSIIMSELKRRCTLVYKYRVINMQCNRCARIMFMCENFLFYTLFIDACDCYRLFAIKDCCYSISQECVAYV